MTKRKGAVAFLLVPPPMRSRRVARRVTSAFHELSRAIERGEASEAARATLEADRRLYQEASVLSTSLYSTSKWVLQVLRRRGLLLQSHRPRVLEVGAINAHLVDSPHVDCRAIDLRSSHPSIEAVDFFDLVPAADYDACVCSLVLNCVPTPAARGRMLDLLRAHLRDDDAAVVFLVLPRACVERSRHMTRDRFEVVLGAAGFREVERRETPKLIHLVLVRAEPDVEARIHPRAAPQSAPPTKRIAADFDVAFHPHDAENKNHPPRGKKSPRRRRATES